MSRFSDFPYFMLLEYMSNLESNNIVNNNVVSTLKSCRLIGREKGILVEGGMYLDLYLKHETDGMLPIRFIYNGLSYEDVNIFRYFKAVKRVIIVDANNVIDNSRTLTNQGIDTTPIPINYDTTNLSNDEYFARLRYQYQTSTSNINFQDIINGDGSTEIYFRKDNAFIDWLKTSAPILYKERYGIDFDIRKYVNFDKDFIYFGNVLLVRNEINDIDEAIIQYRGFKDYVLSCIPSNNRTPNLTTFMYEFFDKCYSSNYHMTKDVWSTVDPFECDERWLYYIGQYYGIDKTFMELTYNKRELLSKMIHFIKRTGTYDSIKYLFSIISNSNNFVNIYDHWLDDNNTTTIHNHMSTYGDYPKYKGAGVSWYNQFNNYPQYNNETKEFVYNSVNTTKLTTCTIQPDITDAIIDGRELLPYNFIKGFVVGCDLFRPINRKYNYSVMLSPIATFNLGDTYSQYNRTLDVSINVENVYSYGKMLLDGRWSFDIEHNQNTLYPYLSISKCKYDNLTRSEQLYNSVYEVRILDSDTINVIFSVSSFKSEFVSDNGEGANYWHNTTTPLSIPVIRVDISRDVLDEGRNTTSYFNSVGNYPLVDMNNLSWCIGYTDINTGIKHKLLDPDNAAYSNYGNYGTYNVSDSNLSNPAYLVRGSITPITIVDEYSSGVSYRLMSIIFEAGSFNINSDVIVDEIVIYQTDNLDNIALYSRCIGLHKPNNTAIILNYKIFNNSDELYQYKNVIKG